MGSVAVPAVRFPAATPCACRSRDFFRYNRPGSLGRAVALGSSPIWQTFLPNIISRSVGDLSGRREGAGNERGCSMLDFPDGRQCSGNNCHGPRSATWLAHTPIRQVGPLHVLDDHRRRSAGWIGHAGIQNSLSRNDIWVVIGSIQMDLPVLSIAVNRYRVLQAVVAKPSGSPKPVRVELVQEGAR